MSKYKHLSFLYAPKVEQYMLKCTAQPQVRTQMDIPFLYAPSV